MENRGLRNSSKDSEMYTITILLFIFILCATLFADAKKMNYYLSYDELLRIRVGVDYGHIGLFGRVAFDREQSSHYKTDKKGIELGFNLNKTLFEYKKMEFIVNGFAGYMLYRVTIERYDNSTFWERMGEFGFVPEIRFYKRASLIVSPCLYRYFWTKDTNGNNHKFSQLKIQNMTLTQIHLGFKFLLF